MEASTEEVRLKGKVQYIMFQKDDWKILSLCIDERSMETVTVTGSFYGVEKDDEINICGKWVTHPKFGKQIESSWWERDMPTTKEGIIGYLSSPLVKGCGKKRAKRIYDLLGENCLAEITKNGASVLLQVSGIGEKQAQSIYESVVSTYEVQSVMKELLPFGLSPNVINKAYLEFKGGTVQLIKENPYKLTELKLIGFQIADKVARKVDVSPLSPYRIESCIEYTLKEQTHANGHCFLPALELLDKTIEELNQPLLNEKEELIKEYRKRDTTVERKVEIDERLRWVEETLVDETLVTQGIISLAGKERIINEEGNIYSANVFLIENQLAKKIVERLRYSAPKVSADKINEAIRKYEEKEGIQLADKQKEGILMMNQNILTILTGGGGTGKTTVTKGMIDVFKQLHPDAKIGLSAPTGRASRKLSEATGIQESCTIHHLIGVRQGETPEYNEDNQLDFDLLVVDEYSMVDVALALMLMKALRPDTAVLFVGDPDQLPSVGLGAVLRDLLEAEIPHVKLIEIFRQARESQIIMNSHRINKGQKIEIDPSKGDFYFIEKEDPQLIADTIKRSVLRFLKLGYTLNDILVLSPMKKGAIGTIELNKMLQDVLNPASPDKRQIEKFGWMFREGDKVIQTKNRGDKDIFNGDIGFLTSIYEKINDDDEKETLIDVNFNDHVVTYTVEELEELQLAYCISIHKSQGGQAPIVIIPVSTSHYKMLARNLLYTGVTRAEKIVVLVGTKKALNIAIRNNNITHRNTLLKERILQQLSMVA